jgi:hypothetical protein
MAGSEDHYVPAAQWTDQIRMLTAARSVTARLFTRSEWAQNHCQVGNYGLALRTIVDWLDRSLLEVADVSCPSVEREHLLLSGERSSAQFYARACQE